MLRIITWIISIAIFALLLVFSLNNLNQTTLNFLGGWSVTVPMIVLVLVVFAAGCVFGMLAMLPFAWRRRKQAKNKAIASKPVVASPPVAAAEVTQPTPPI